MAVAPGVFAEAKVGSGTSITTAGIATTSGSTMFALVGAGSVGATGTVNLPTDSKSNTWTAINATFTLNYGGIARIFYAGNIVGGAGHTFTGNFSASNANITIYVFEIKNADTGSATSSLDQSVAWLTDTTSPFTTNITGTTTFADEMSVFAFCGDNTATTVFTWGNGYTEAIADGAASGVLTGGLGYKSLSTTTTEQGSMTGTNLVNGNGVVATFKGLSGGGGGPVVSRIFHASRPLFGF